MQYLLTEEEYKALTEQKRQRDAAETKTLQHLCSMVAVHMPVECAWWAEEPATDAPWGCPLVPEHLSPAGYCDECPVKRLCPHTPKLFSK